MDHAIVAAERGMGRGRRRHRSLFFFFQAEDGIRDLTVTGVQTCALPISRASSSAARLPAAATSASAFPVIASRSSAPLIGLAGYITVPPGPPAGAADRKSVV